MVDRNQFAFIIFLTVRYNFPQHTHNAHSNKKIRNISTNESERFVYLLPHERCNLRHKFWVLHTKRRGKNRIQHSIDAYARRIDRLYRTRKQIIPKPIRCAMFASRMNEHRGHNTGRQTQRESKRGRERVRFWRTQVNWKNVREIGVFSSWMSMEETQRRRRWRWSDCKLIIERYLWPRRRSIPKTEFFFVHHTAYAYSVYFVFASLCHTATWIQVKRNILTIFFCSFVWTKDTALTSFVILRIFYSRF